MKKNKPLAIIYLCLNIAFVVAIVTLYIVKAANGYSIRGNSSDFLFAPIVACKLSAVGINLLYSLYLMIRYREKSFKQWSGFIPLLILFAFVADTMNSLSIMIVFYICFMIAYSIPYLFRKPKLIEGFVRLGVMIVVVVLIFVLEQKLSLVTRLTAGVGVTLIVTVVFAAIYYTKDKSKYNLYLLISALFALVSDVFLAIAFLTSSSLIASNILSMFVWPTYLVEFIFLNIALEKSLASSEA